MNFVFNHLLRYCILIVVGGRFWRETLGICTIIERFSFYQNSRPIATTKSVFDAKFTLFWEVYKDVELLRNIITSHRISSLFKPGFAAFQKWRHHLEGKEEQKEVFVSTKEFLIISEWRENDVFPELGIV